MTKKNTSEAEFFDVQVANDFSRFEEIHKVRLSNKRLSR